MSNLLQMFLALAESGVNAVINTSASPSVSRSTVGVDCYAGLEVNSDGKCYGNNADGSASWSSKVDLSQDWLSSGSSTGVYVEYTLYSGTPDWVDDYGGAGTRVAVSSNPRIGPVRTASMGADAVAIDLKFYDAASGGTLLGTIGPFGVSAAKT